MSSYFIIVLRGLIKDYFITVISFEPDLGANAMILIAFEVISFSPLFGVTAVSTTLSKLSGIGSIVSQIFLAEDD